MLQVLELEFENRGPGPQGSQDNVGSLGFIRVPGLGKSPRM